MCLNTFIFNSGLVQKEIVVYKNLLQELGQKGGFQLPAYDTTQSGKAHAPVFISQVQILHEFNIIIKLN
jgi:dsRNA-specific ribonuclease